MVLLGSTQSTFGNSQNLINLGGIQSGCRWGQTDGGGSSVKVDHTPVMVVVSTLMSTLPRFSAF